MGKEIKSITFYYDPVSTFSYIAYYILIRYKSIWGFDKLIMKPVLLGGVMAKSKNQAPLAIPTKSKYTREDALRLAEWNDIHMTLPDNFPVKTLNGIRFLRQLEEEKPELNEIACVKFWDAVFGPTKYDPNDMASFEKIMAGVDGLSADDIRQITKRSQSDANKARVKDDAEKLVTNQEVFGFPWLVVECTDGTKETYWGSDRFELMAHRLGLEWRGPNPGKAKAKL